MWWASLCRASSRPYNRAVANARIVLAQGLIDGANTVFRTGVPYVPGSTAYILNGRIHSLQAARGPENPYGYTESSPDSGEITVDEPPLDGDVVQIFFWDRLVVPVPAVTRLSGVIRETRLRGVVREPVVERLVGIIRKC